MAKVAASALSGCSRNWDCLIGCARSTCSAGETFEGRLGLVIRRLAGCAYLAGDRFTAADISVSYALLLGLRTGNYVPGSIERDYLARTTARPTYLRAMESCQATKAWA